MSDAAIKPLHLLLKEAYDAVRPSDLSISAARISALSWKAPNPRPAGFSAKEATPTSST